ncbi:MAG: hypothetical protein SFT81_03060 [Candidatus Caenarcaniphilales bacterium]|nr:hypothetical protein [Candidatus Caenarcaniphilales bacterium]
MTNHRSKQNVFSSLVAGTSLIIGAVYFVGWSYRYIYYSKFSIPSVVPEFDPISFFGLTFNLVCGPFFMNRFRTGNTLGDIAFSLGFFILPLLLVVLTSLLSDFARKIMLLILRRLNRPPEITNTSPLKVREKILRYFTELGRYFVTHLLVVWDFVRDMLAAIGVLIILYVLGSIKATQDFERDLVESTSRLYRISLFVKSPKGDNAMTPIYPVLNDFPDIPISELDPVTCVGDCKHAPPFCSLESSWRLLLRLRDNLYLIRTIPALTHSGSSHQGTVILQHNEDNKDILVVLKPAS